MTRQFIKGMTMLLLIVALAFVTAVASANAQSIANVPFDFVAGGKSMAAGHYNVSNSTTGGEIVRISSSSNETAFSLATKLNNGRPAQKSKLVFHRYGNRYFLAEIWKAGDSQGQKLVKSREERAVERELASISSRRDAAQRGYERVEIALGRQ
jgi:hypothetical protein